MSDVQTRAERTTVLLERMPRDEVRRVGAEGLIVVPLGATEQHGPHLPVGTDSLHVEHVTRSAARAVADRLPIAVAPTLPYGCSDHHLPFGGTLSLRSETLGRVLADLARSLAASGCRRLFLVNGHGGNHEPMQVAARDAAQACGIDVASASWWALAAGDLEQARGGLAIRVPGHAGGFETSLMQTLAPETVLGSPPPRAVLPRAARAERAEHGYRVDRAEGLAAADGFTDEPGLGSTDLGRAALAAGVAALAAAFLDFMDGGA